MKQIENKGIQFSARIGERAKDTRRVGIALTLTLTLGHSLLPYFEAHTLPFARLRFDSILALKTAFILV